MKAVIQRVARSSLVLGGDVTCSISKGYTVLVGVTNDDTDEDAKYIAKKVLSTKLFDNGDQRWARSVTEVDGEILLVSQFTLYARMKGTKPDFHRSLTPELSKSLYEKVVSYCKSLYKEEKCKAGVFGRTQEVHIVNDGPVTIIIDSREKY